jgi:hypothetical protein
MEYQFTDDMREISGFGDGYEDMCRQMVVAGLQWLDAHPNADPQFHSYQNVMGILIEDNDDAKALTEAVVAPSDGGCSGAMHQAAMSHIFYIRKHGWEKYRAEMQRLKLEEATK